MLKPRSTYSAKYAETSTLILANVEIADISGPVLCVLSGSKLKKAPSTADL